MKRFMFFWISQVLSRLPIMSELQRSHFGCNKSFQPSWLKNQWDKTQRIFTLNSLFIQLLGEWCSNKNLSFHQLHPSIDSMASWLDAPLHQGRIAWCVSHSSEADEGILDSTWEATVRSSSAVLRWFCSAQTSRQGPLYPLRANPFAKVADLFCRLPLPTLLYRPDATNLGDLMRLWVRPGPFKSRRIDLFKWINLSFGFSRAPEWRILPMLWVTKMLWSEGCPVLDPLQEILSASPERTLKARKVAEAVDLPFSHFPCFWMAPPRLFLLCNIKMVIPRTLSSLLCESPGLHATDRNKDPTKADTSPAITCQWIVESRFDPHLCCRCSIST